MYYFVCNDIPLDYDWYIKSRWDVIHTVWEDSLDDLVDIINNGQDDSIHCLARNFRIKDGDIGFLDFAYMFDNILYYLKMYVKWTSNSEVKGGKITRPHETLTNANSKVLYRNKLYFFDNISVLLKY